MGEHSEHAAESSHGSGGGIDVSKVADLLEEPLKDIMSSVVEPGVLTIGDIAPLDSMAGGDEKKISGSGGGHGGG